MIARLGAAMPVWIEARDGGYLVRWRDQRLAWKGSALRESTRDAQALKRKMQAELRALRENRRGVPGTLLPFTEILKRWQIAVLTDDRPVTSDYATEVVDRLTKLATAVGWITTGDITTAAVENVKTMRAGRVKYEMRLLRSVLSWARDALGQPVEHQVVKPRRARRGSAMPKELPGVLLSDGQVATLVERAGTHDGRPYAAGRALAHYLATYGARPITAARIQVGDVNLVAGELTLRHLKHAAPIVHALTQHTRDLLAPLCVGRSSTDPLFTTPPPSPRKDEQAFDPLKAWPISQGRSLSMLMWWRRTVCKGVDGLTTQARGIYNLKRYAITKMRQAGIDLETIARFTGHGNVRSLLIYTRSDTARTHEVLARVPSIRHPEGPKLSGQPVGTPVADGQPVGG